MSKPPFTTSSSLLSGCYTCNRGDAQWHGHRAISLAKRHLRETGHKVWVEKKTMFYPVKASPTPEVSQ
jgi:hypothetical protein